MKFDSGDAVILVLREPREKLLGILKEISEAGITLRGIDLTYFDDWTSSMVRNEPHLPMSDVFFPMWRVERLSRDESGDGIESMTDQFERRTGRRLVDL